MIKPKPLIITIFLLFFLFFPLISQEVLVTGPSSPVKGKPGDEITIPILYQFPSGYHQTLVEDFFYIKLAGEEDRLEGDSTKPMISIIDVEYPEGIVEDQVVNYYGTVELIATVRILPNTAPGQYQFTVSAGYQICDDQGVCFFPQEIQIPVELTIIEGSGTSILTLLQFFLMAVLGGIILNVMPCVLPVLSIKALNLVNQSKEDESSPLLHSILYAGGILISLLTLAVIIIILKISGESIGWGFQFQNPYFVISLTVLLFVFALSLFDVFTITPPGMTKATAAASKKGFAGSFTSGIVAVLLATPCTAPFLGAALGFAFSQPPGVIIMIFTGIAIGLAFPFLLIGMNPKLLKLIPKPGEWMNIFKEAMGFLLLGTAVWLLSVLYKQVGRGIIQVIIFLGIAGLASWIYGRISKGARKKITAWIGLGIAAVILVIGAAITLRFDTETAAEEFEKTAGHSEIWQPFDPDSVLALVAEGEPVFIDFHADWCLTCQVNKKTVLNTPGIEEMLSNYEIHLFQGDYTREDDVITEWIARFGKAGVPVYAFYPPGESEPVILPEILKKDSLEKTISSYFAADRFF